jgi:hypothetical protein
MSYTVTIVKYTYFDNDGYTPVAIIEKRDFATKGDAEGFYFHGGISLRDLWLEQKHLYTLNAAKHLAFSKAITTKDESDREEVFNMRFYGYPNYEVEQKTGVIF